jgi:hypothetical protein
VEWASVADIGSSLIPIHGDRDRQDLSNLSDDELIASLRAPRDGNYMQVKADGRIMEGNGRAWEVRRRASSPDSSIELLTEFPYERME